MNRKLFIFAGEKSGDLLGSHLIKALAHVLPGFSIEGVGGPEMRDVGLECIRRSEEFECHGFSDILKSLPKFRKQFNFLRNHIIRCNPQAAILIDYPGFNMRMAKALRNKGYKGKLIQYISPTVWAWGKKRIQRMEQALDLLLCIYPFEPPYFKNSSLSVKYVGNPIKEIIHKHDYDDNWARLFGIKDSQNLVAIFPGSRSGEIQQNLPYQLKAAELLKKKYPKILFVISCAHEKIIPVMQNILNVNTLRLNHDIYLLPKGYSYELMRDARASIATSGTVTLELALHCCPTVTIYKLTSLNRLIAKYLLRLNLPHYCIVNILAGKTVFPELIAKGLTAHNIYLQLKSLLEDTAQKKQCLEGCKNIPTLLSDHDASVQAAKAIKDILK